MDIAPKALYNSLRMRWLQDPTIAVEPWKVEDWRAVPLEELFERLEEEGIVLDKASFCAYADACDSPEELTEWFFEGELPEQEIIDHIYLSVFELWRRILPEKPSISILCDDLDQAVFRYDASGGANSDEVEGALEAFLTMLEENVDAGAEALDVSEAVREYLACDLDRFIYDYLVDIIDEGEFLESSDLIRRFRPFSLDIKLLDLAHARIEKNSDPDRALRRITDLMGTAIAEKDLELTFELLELLLAFPAVDFRPLARHASELIETHEELAELLLVCKDLAHMAANRELEEWCDAASLKLEASTTQTTLDVSLKSELGALLSK